MGDALCLSALGVMIFVAIVAMCNEARKRMSPKDRKLWDSMTDGQDD